MAAERGLERHELRARVRELRQRLQLSQEELAEVLGWHRSKVYRIEAGRTPISPDDLASLLARLPDVPDDEGADLLTLARSAKRATPAPPHQGLSPSARRYVDYESAAREIWNYEPMFVPGLLQVPAYTEALLTGLSAKQPAPAAVRRAVEVRGRRQQILTRRAPVDLHVLLDESAIVRRVGDRTVMVRQLEHLWAMSERPNVSLAVVPFDHGVHPMLRAPFVVMRLAEHPRAGMLFIENTVNEVITVAGEDSTTDPADYLDAFERVSRSALTGDAVAERLKRALRQTAVETT